MTTITNNKLPEWRTALDKCVENYQSTVAWYEENRDSPAALDDMERAEDQLANFVRKCGFSIVLSLLDEIDELQELRRNYLALRGEIEDVQSQLYEAENQLTSTPASYRNAAGWTGYSTLSVRCVECRVIIPITHKWLWHMSTAPSQCR